MGSGSLIEFADPARASGRRGFVAPLVLLFATVSAFAHVDAIEGCTPGYC